MKIPVTNTEMQLARLYATESIEHTENYDGWEGEAGTQRKFERIMIGRFAQLWLERLCQTNGIPYKADHSGPRIADNYDLEIAGDVVDVKASTVKPLAGQVNRKVYKDEKIDQFAFFFVDSSLGFISPLGVISKQEYRDHSHLVKKGEELPDTNLKQRYENGSYFINHDDLDSLWVWLKNAQCRESCGDSVSSPAIGITTS